MSRGPGLLNLMSNRATDSCPAVSGCRVRSVDDWLALQLSEERTPEDIIGVGSQAL